MRARKGLAAFRKLRVSERRKETDYLFATTCGFIDDAKQKTKAKRVNKQSEEKKSADDEASEMSHWEVAAWFAGAGSVVLGVLGLIEDGVPGLLTGILFGAPIGLMFLVAIILRSLLSVFFFPSLILGFIGVLIYAFFWA